MAQLERLTEGRFTRALEKGRDRFNALFAAAARNDRDLTPEAFASALAKYAAPLVEAIGSLDESKVDDATAVAYNATLELVAMDLLGEKNRAPAMNRAFGETLPGIAKLAAESPRKIVPAVLNAVFNLSSHSPKIAESWMDAMKKAAPLCDNATLFVEAGKVVAWRLGMAHYRDGALAAWRNLPDRLKYATLDVGESMSRPSISQLAEIVADPWRLPSGAGGASRKIMLVHRIGGFVGFGGKFLNPPTVFCDGAEVYAVDTRKTFVLHADIFGATVSPRSGPDPEIASGTAGGLRLDKSGAASLDGAKASFPQLAGWSSSESLGNAVFVAMPNSHYIYIIAAVSA